VCERERTLSALAYAFRKQFGQGAVSRYQGNSSQAAEFRDNENSREGSEKASLKTVLLGDLLRILHLALLVLQLHTQPTNRC
jgi:hypothetical protein